MTKEINFHNLLLIEAIGRIRTLEKKILKEHNLKLSPKLLSYIVLIDSGEFIKQTDLLKYLDVSKGTLSNMIKHLEDKRYIKIEKFKSDKRKNKIALTDKGLEVVKVNEIIRKKVKEHLLSKISEEELDYLTNIALKLK